MEIFLSSQGLLDLFTLSLLEIILGIDNVIFIAILVHNLPSNQRRSARFLGLGLALILRIIMLLGASWVISLTVPLFKLYDFEFSGRNLLLIIGGIFLIVKSILELFELFDDKNFDPVSDKNHGHKYWKIIFQIVFIDLILSFDSIITAVGITNHLITIITAIFISLLVMLFSSKAVGDFIYKYPSIKVVALCFIALVGAMLVANGFDFDFPKSYLYLTMFFTMIVEIINIAYRNKKNKVTKGSYD